MQLTNAVAEMERSYIRASTLCGQILATLNLQRNKELFKKKLSKEESGRFLKEIDLWNKIFERDVSYNRFAVLLEDDKEENSNSPAQSGPTNTTQAAIELAEQFSELHQDPFVKTVMPMFIRYVQAQQSAVR